jgi:hypothetical protein
MLAQGGTITVASSEKNTSFTLVFLKASYRSDLFAKL